GGRTGNGLTGLTERLTAAGGSLTARPGAHGGFTVTAELPTPTDVLGARTAHTGVRDPCAAPTDAPAPCTAPTVSGLPSGCATPTLGP
ncbi:MAG: sensor histidine kinase, partial [Streptomyces sp.]|nr:sensor histidine kinase [Streptomyces sp.]